METLAGAGKLGVACVREQRGLGFGLFREWMGVSIKRHKNWG